MIPFNRPHLTGNETKYIEEAVLAGKISGNGAFTQLCHSFFQDRYGFPKVLLTSSCTDALEMAAILSNVGPGDEVVMPSFTFVSTANAFILRGATIRFADCESATPNIDCASIERRINERTKAIVVVHYAGIACDMDRVMSLAQKYNLLVIEDAAHSVDSFYKTVPLGGIGHLSTFSFHETKNIISGEGGMLVIREPSLQARAEIIWEKGTNRSALARGEVKKYEWIDIGSSFLPSEVTAAFLWAQLENLDEIQNRRKSIWKYYYDALAIIEQRGQALRPVVPNYAMQNGHLFYLKCKSLEQRQELIAYLKSVGILAVFHYLPLHLSPFFLSKQDGVELPMSVEFANTIVRLPLFFDLQDDQMTYIVDHVKAFFDKNATFHSGKSC